MNVTLDPGAEASVELEAKMSIVVAAPVPLAPSTFTVRVADAPLVSNKYKVTEPNLIALMVKFDALIDAETMRPSELLTE
jgi:hypothetical protein